MKSIFAFLIVAISLSNCSDKDETPTTANMRVNYYTEKCIGEMEGECLLVQEGANIGSDDWQFFYYASSIEGFNYEPGFIYDLLVKKNTIENPPMDASSIKYELVEIVTKTEVDL
ncbi:MAG: DUF4377 domain-containing protein [Cyclobacteriaceae bacterium]